MRQWLRQAPGYGYWQWYRGRRQRRDFERLLDRYLGTPGGGRSDEATVRLAIESRGRLRRRVEVDSRPAVLGFGTTEWEGHGLWQAFSNVADFQLFDYQGWMRANRVVPSDRRAGALLEAAVRAELDLRLAAGWTPSVVFFYAAGRYISDGLLQELANRGVWSIVMSLDDKHQFVGPIDEQTGESHQLRVARSCDVYWTTWKTGTQIVACLGGRPWYAPEGANPSFHRPLPVNRDLEVVFVGQSYGTRGALVDYLRRRGFGVEAFGRGWPTGFMSFEKTVELFSRAEVVLGVGGVGHLAGVKHLKGRDFEVPMCGAAYLTSFNPELADHFEIGREILCYGSMEECADVLHWLRRRPAEREAIRAAALRRSRRDHSWEVRLRQCLGQIAEPAPRDRR